MKETVEQALRDILGNLPEGSRVERPRDPRHGDLSTNTAFILAKKEKRNPSLVAETLAEKLSENPAFEQVSPAGGFINFRFSKDFLISSFRKVLNEGEDYFKKDIGKGMKIQLEYVSANPTGPLHLGHGRGAVVGDALSRILSFLGYDVSREYYINDAGRQVYLLGTSVFYRYLELFGRKDLMERIRDTFEKEGYRGEYIKEIARLLSAIVGTKLADGSLEESHRLLMESDLPFEKNYLKSFKPKSGTPEELCSLFGLDFMMREIKRDLSDLGVEFDSWVSEREFHMKGEVEEVLRRLEEGAHTYESDGALWLKTQERGDDKDRVLKKSEGSFTYFASDIAYHLDKFNRGYEKVIDLWGSDHHGYIMRLRIALSMLGIPDDWLEVYLIQMVRLFKNGKEIKMSKRAGTFVPVREVMEEVGADAVRFIFLTRRSDTHLDFDINLVKEKSSDNPVFYVQYAHARIAGVFREFKKRFSEDPEEVIKNADLSRLSSEAETGLMKKVLFLKDEILTACRGRDPHLITFYLIDLAGSFHNYYNHNRIIGSEQSLMEARLALLKGIRTALALGLKLIGVSAPERM